jgi:uncharacterized membrane protein YeaQ/YmgE (transglycosylase-associated protein family)
LVGAEAGWLASKILKGNDYGPTMDTGMVLGGAIAGRILDAIGWFERLQTGQLQPLRLPVVGAGIFTVIAGLVNGRRMSAGQL